MARIRPHIRALLLHAAVVGGLLTVSLVIWWHVWVTGDPSSSVTCHCGDTALNIWFVKWTEWSITHLHNPLYSNAVFAGQGGANTMDTDGLAPGLLAFPFTAAFGPVVGFNVLSLLVPVVNGWSMFFLLRTVVGFLPGDLLGSIYYAFVPDFVENMTIGHFNVDAAFFPPLALWCAYDLLVRRRHRPALIGALLGGLVVVQFFLGPELLAMCALIAVLGGALVAARAPHLVWSRRLDLLRAGVVASAVSVVLLAYPMWFFLAGPRHTSGYPWPNTPAAGTTLANLVTAGAAGAPNPGTELGGYYGPQGPPYSYLGWAVLVLLAVSAVVWRRRVLAQCLVWVGVLGAVLGLGTGGYGVASSVWLPWRLFDHAPVLMEILPMRFALFTAVAVAVLLALSLKGWWEWLVRITSRGGAPFLGGIRHGLDVMTGCLLFLAGASVLVPIVVAEGLPFTVYATTTPAWITRVAATLAPGTVVLVLPDASSGVEEAMYWQAEDNFSYEMIGGFMLVPGADGHDSDLVDPPAGAPSMLDKLSFYGTPPAATAGQTQLMRAALSSWGVDVVVVTSAVPDDTWDAGFFTAVLGRPPLYQDGSWVWYGLGKDAPFGLPPQRLFGCWSVARNIPLGVPDCVLRTPRVARA